MRQLLNVRVKPSPGFAAFLEGLQLPFLVFANVLDSDFTTEVLEDPVVRLVNNGL